MMNADDLYDFPPDWNPARFMQLCEQAISQLEPAERDARLELAGDAGLSVRTRPGFLLLMVEWPAGVPLVAIHFGLLARPVSQN